MMKKKILIGIGILAAVAVLAGAAYLGARLLVQGNFVKSNNSFKGGPGSGITISKGEGGMMKQSVKLDITPAEEIPARTPEIRGVITEVKDNSLMVATDFKMNVTMTEDGQPNANVQANGPLTEVVLTKETLVYTDTTFANRAPDDELPAEGEKIQQMVELASFADLEAKGAVSVWGYKRGDRLVAEVILSDKPIMFRKR